MIEAHAQQERASLRLRPLRILDLGLIPYDECWEMQRQIAEDVGRANAPETLLLLEHPHTFTCGKRGGRENILAPPMELTALGATVLDVDRGGDVTYHGPGQLVAYPIINLRKYGENIDYPAYVRRLEDVLFGTLASFEISAGRVRFLSGAWYLGGDIPEKIAAIGVKVDGKGVTTHGIALNVNTDLRFFNYIIPCGIRGKGVTSMSKLLGYEVDLNAVKLSFAQHFEHIFSFTHALQIARDQNTGS
jgi:lipoyl(octanoyl) transferase